MIIISPLIINTRRLNYKMAEETEDNSESLDVETFEVELNDKEIDETIAKLQDLKKNKGSATIEFAADLEVTIKYDDGD